MSLGENEFDALAYALVNADFDFDAVEHGSLRAEWTDDNAGVVVRNGDTDEEVVYTADDLVLATSDRELRNARTPESGSG